MNNTSYRMLVCALGLILASACRSQPSADYPIQPVPFTQVEVMDSFWQPRMETNRTETIPFAMKMNAETGRLDNFAIAAGIKQGRYQGRRFNDTDVYKVIEGAAYSLRLHPDPALEQALDDLVELIAAAQEADGYLYAARTAHPEDPSPGAGPTRWSRLRGSHELYNAGHMYEAAVAYFQAAGKRRFLDIALRNADLLVQTFGPDKRRDVPGHQEIEIGLAKLFRVTGRRDYLELAKFFLDERGHEHDTGWYAEDTPFSLYNQKAYMQDHLPVLEQEEAVGHAVRATYMYTGMADVAALGGHPEYIRAIDRLWEDVVSRKLYLTGGVGARHTSEAFGEAYELPNASAYTETCAAIGNAFWNHRMFLLHGDAKYIDVMERVIYNGLISGVSLTGDCFFYQNPLASRGQRERSPWFEVSCCPGNITRFIPSLPGYIYARKQGNIFVNLFVESTAEMEFPAGPVRIRQETRYPWEGKVRIALEPESALALTLNIRIPGWAQELPVPSDLYRYLEKKDLAVVLKVNGEILPLDVARGYACIHRTWEPGDWVELDIPMPVRRVVAHDKVAADQGRVALERGPLVYCAEEIDNEGGVSQLVIADESRFQIEFRPDFLGGAVLLKGPAGETGEGGEEFIPALKQRLLTAIPYYAWAHRGPAEMAVWFQRR